MQYFTYKTYSNNGATNNNDKKYQYKQIDNIKEIISRHKNLSIKSIMSLNKTTKRQK
jgi:hypothetical protein